MVTKIFLVSFMLIATLSMSSCIGTSSDYGVKLSCEQFDESSHYISGYNVRVGSKIRIKLCSNPTTGFQWDYKLTTKNIVIEENHDFEESAESIVGATSIESWIFEAVEKGTTEIKMEYSRPRENGLEAERTYTAKVTVQ